MNRFIEILGQLVGFARTHVFQKKRLDQLSRTTGKYLQKYERVENRAGEQGRVWRVYRSLETEEVVGCSVLWDHEFNGDKISPFLPAGDYGPLFNPIIRRVREKTY